LYRCHGSAIDCDVCHWSVVKRLIAVPVHSEYRGVASKPVTAEINGGQVLRSEGWFYYVLNVSVTSLTPLVFNL